MGGAEKKASYEEATSTVWLLLRKMVADDVWKRVDIYC